MQKKKAGFSEETRKGNRPRMAGRRQGSKEGMGEESREEERRGERREQNMTSPD